MPLSIGADPWAPGRRPGRFTAGSDSEPPVFLVWAAMPEGTTEGGLWRESRKSFLLAPACAAMCSGRCLDFASLSPLFCFPLLSSRDQGSLAKREQVSMLHFDS